MVSKAITSEVIQLRDVRLSFADKLFVPEAFEEGKKKQYSSSFLLDPSHKPHVAIIKRIKAVGEELIKAKEWEDVRLKGRCYGYADEDELTYDGYEGMFYVRAALDTRPVIVDTDLTPLDSSDGKPYAGCYVNGTITLWTQDHPVGGKRINANLRGVQFLRDGESFGGAPRIIAEEEFDPVEPEEDDSDTGSVFG